MSERVQLVSPAGLIYVVELDYVAGFLRDGRTEWQGWRVRYSVAGEPLLRELFIDGSESRQPDEEHLAAAVDQHFRETAIATDRRLRPPEL